MTDNVSRGATPPRSERTDKILKYVVVVLVAAVIGLAAFFAYTIWETNQVESTATPAQRALVGLRDFVRKNPNSAAGRVRYGEALASAGKFNEAVEQLKAAVKLDPKHTGAYLDLGIIAMQQDQRKAAEGYFDKVLTLTAGQQFENINQRREQALFHLGEIALDDKRYEEAAGYFKQSLRIRKDASDTYYLLATALYRLGDEESAIEQLEAALAFDPNYAEAHYLYGVILLERKDRINAAVHLRKAVDLAPDVKIAREALEELGSAKDAIKRSEQALANKNLTVAIDEALLARQIDPESVDAAEAHLRAVMAKGDDKAAADIASELKKLDPKNKLAAQVESE